MNDPESKTPSLESLVLELRQLRKGEGAGMYKLRACESLCGLRQVHAIASSTSSEGLALGAYKVLRSRLLALNTDERVRLAGRALGFGVNPPGNLTSRRALSMADGYSLTTVREWEDTGIEILAFDLLRDHLEPVADGLAGESSWAVDFDLVSVDLEYQFTDSRIPARWRDSRILRAKVNGVGDILIKHLYTGSSKVEVAVETGGRIDDTFKGSDAATGFHAQRIILDRPLMSGEIHQLVVVKRILGDGAEPLPFVTFVPEQQVGEALVCVQFGDYLPKDGPWQIISYAHSLPSPINQPKLVTLSQDRRAAVVFRSLQPGFAYGLSWSW